MAIPATGGTYTEAGLADLDSHGLERGKLVQIWVRDARGAVTDISPHNPDGSVKWSPFALDGTWRKDLSAFRLSGGTWSVNSVDNEGWHIVGAFKDGDGPTSKPNIRNDDFMILQSNFPFDSDVTEEGEPFSFTPVETAKPLIRRLRNNLPLVSADGTNLVELPGNGAGWSRPLEADNVDRQFLLVRELKKPEGPIYKVDGYARARLSDLGNSKMDKKDSEAAELSYQPLPDGFYMAVQDGEYKPILRHTWVGGTGWTAQAGAAGFTVTLGTPSAGTFTLTFRGNTTAGIAYNAASSAVKSALVALDDGFTTSDWAVTGSAGGPYSVTTPGGPLTGSGTGLTGGTFSVVAA